MRKLLVFGIALLFFAAGCSQQTESYTPGNVTPPGVTFTPRASDTPEQETPEASDTPTPATTPAPLIASSAPTALYLPNIDEALRINTVPQSLTCGSTIPYPTSGPNVWKAFYCDDYALPGTNMPHYGIITGHSTKSDQTDTIMNRLLAQSSTIVGKEILIKTKTSGNRWLAFRFTAVYSVDKKYLGDATELWGDSATSTAGRIVFLTCGQSRFGQNPDDNIGFVAEFVGVR